MATTNPWEVTSTTRRVTPTSAEQTVDTDQTRIRRPTGRLVPEGASSGKGGGTVGDPGRPGKGRGTVTGAPNLDPGNPMLPNPYEGRGFADPHIRPVAGPNPYQEWAAGLMPGMIGPTDLEGEAAGLLRQGVSTGQQGVTGAGLPGGPAGTNPTFEATRRAFEEMTIPQIRQQRTLMGLGDSNAVTNDISRAWAGVLPTLVENELGREERGLERASSTAFGGASGLAGLSGQQTQREFGAADRGFGYGSTFRGIADDANRAIYEDFLRRQGLAENLLLAPLGGTPSTIGERRQQGGLFK